MTKGAEPMNVFLFASLGSKKVGDVGAPRPRVLDNTDQRAHKGRYSQRQSESFISNRRDGETPRSQITGTEPKNQIDRAWPKSTASST